MAPSDQPQPPRRGPAAYQPIEALDEGTGGPPQAPAPRAAPGPAAAPPAAGPQVPAEAPQADRAAPVVPIGVRFASAAAALSFAGQMLSIGRADGLTFAIDEEQSRWARAQAELDIARELAEAARGTLFVEVAPGRLAEDRGWGDPPAADVFAASGMSIVGTGTLEVVSLARLVRAAGLQQVRERPATAAHVLLPGALMESVLRRALDMRLDVVHRPVRMRPLFTEPGEVPADTVFIEMRLSAPEGNEVPSALLAALSREPRLALLRSAGDDGRLLVQYGMAAPLPDALLAGLIQGSAWVLANPQFGSHLLEPAGTFIDSASCVRLADGYQLQSPPMPPSDDGPVLPTLRVVRMRTYGRGIDAVLLTGADLEAVALLFEGHPLSESAQLIRGRDRHLLVAAGGFLDQLPVGDSLYRLGPGPLYLPLGHGTRPQLPSSARRTLFTPDEKTIVVLLPAVMLKFDASVREPVWRLWAGPLPELDLQLPEGAVSALRAVPGFRRGGRATGGGSPGRWRQADLA